MVHIKFSVIFILAAATVAPVIALPIPTHPSTTPTSTHAGPSTSPSTSETHAPSTTPPTSTPPGSTHSQPAVEKRISHTSRLGETEVMPTIYEYPKSDKSESAVYNPPSKTYGGKQYEFKTGSNGSFYKLVEPEKPKSKKKFPTGDSADSSIAEHPTIPSTGSPSGSSTTPSTGSPSGSSTTPSTGSPSGSSRRRRSSGVTKPPKHLLQKPQPPT